MKGLGGGVGISKRVTRTGIFENQRKQTFRTMSADNGLLWWSQGRKSLSSKTNLSIGKDIKRGDKTKDVRRVDALLYTFNSNALRVAFEKGNNNSKGEKNLMDKKLDTHTLMLGGECPKLIIIKPGKQKKKSHENEVNQVEQ